MYGYLKRLEDGDKCVNIYDSSICFSCCKRLR